jgi:hypothetical protein
VNVLAEAISWMSSAVRSWLKAAPEAGSQVFLVS